jgi:electron transfer flavoprotein beta subunit
MPELHIVVCIKVVPKPEEIGVDAETQRIVREGVRSEINPVDMNALEVALRLKDEHGGRITLLSMGPPFFESFLRVGLAMGADDVVLLSDREFAGADTLATTYTLALGIEKIGEVDLIICGEESSDGATGQVPSGVAEWLGLPQITLLSSVELGPNERVVLGRREYGGGYEILEAPLPAVLSVKTASNEPRFMDYEVKDWAFERADVILWDQEALAAEADFIGLSGSPTMVTGLREAPSRERRREFLTGDQDEIVSELIEIIKIETRTNET